jgi:hypothetical protein
MALDSRWRGLAALALCLAGCASPVPLYEGPARPDAEVALLSFAGSASVLQIDGEDMDSREQLFALEPGPHLVLFRVRRTHLDFGSRRGSIEASSVAPQITTHCFVTVPMEAGHRYEVVSGVWDARKVDDKAKTGRLEREHITRVVAGIRDETSGELVPDVKCDRGALTSEGR